MADARLSARAVWAVALLWAALALNYADRQMPYSMFPALRSGLGFSEGQLGLIGTVFGWVYALAMPVAGRLADRWRRDRMIAASVALWSAATLGCGLAASALSFILCRAAIAVTEALYYPAAAGYIARLHPGPSRSKALGAHQSAQFAGLIAGGWFGGWMADNWSWRTAFLWASGAGFVYAVILARSLPAEPPLPRPSSAPGPAGWRGLFVSPCYLALCAAFFTFCAMLWVFYTWYPAFLHERYQLSMTASGFNATVFVQASCAAGVLAGAAAADRISVVIPGGRFYVAAAGILLSAPFGYLTFSTHSLDLARLCSALYGFFAGLMIANAFAAAYDVIDPRLYGAGAGFLNMTGGVASGFTIYAAGVLKSSIGFDGLLAWVALACAGSAAALIWVVRARFRLNVDWREKTLI